MICDSLSSWQQNLRSLPPALKKALKWAERNSKAPPVSGKYPLESDAYVLVQNYTPKEWKSAEFENHHKFVDVQVVVLGIECILWTKPQSLKVTKPYADEKDAENFQPDPNKEYTCLVMGPGSFVIFWPSDWHMPGLQPSRTTKSGQQFPAVLKFVIKVPVE